MASCRDAGRAVDLLAHVALIGHQRRAGVQADAGRGRPVRQAGGDDPRCLKCASCRRKGDEEAVALRADLHSALRHERRAHDAAVLGKDRGVLFLAQRLEQPSRALDVAEEEGDACPSGALVASPLDHHY